VTAIAAELRALSARRRFLAIGVAAITALVIGIPTDVIPNSVFGRMTSVTWWSYPVWAATAALAGLAAATSAGRRGRSDRLAGRREARTAGAGGVLVFLAIGCPTCNKLAVLALGTGGAGTYFGPAQPYVGLVGLALLAGALVLQLRGASACRIR
jgi:hypothetical protein